MDYKRVVLNWFKGNDLALWRLKNGQDETVAKVLEDETPDEAIARLAMNLDNLPTGLYKLYARKKKTDSNGEVVHNFYVPEHTGQASQVSANIQGDPFAERLAKLEAQLEKAKEREREQKLEQEKKEIEEKWRKKYEKLQEQQEKPDVLDRITGLLGMLNIGVNVPFNIGAKKQPAINGIPPAHQSDQQEQSNQEAQSNQQEAQENVNNIVRTSLSKMRNIFEDDNSFLQFLQTAGNIAETEPQKFSMLLKFMGQNN